MIGTHPAALTAGSPSSSPIVGFFLVFPFFRLFRVITDTTLSSSLFWTPPGVAFSPPPRCTSFSSSASCLAPLVVSCFLELPPNHPVPVSFPSMPSFFLHSCPLFPSESFSLVIPFCVYSLMTYFCPLFLTQRFTQRLFPCFPHTPVSPPLQHLSLRPFPATFLTAGAYTHDPSLGSGSIPP